MHHPVPAPPEAAGLGTEGRSRPHRHPIHLPAVSAEPYPPAPAWGKILVKGTGPYSSARIGNRAASGNLDVGGSCVVTSISHAFESSPGHWAEPSAWRMSSWASMTVSWALCLGPLLLLWRDNLG